MNTIRLNFNAVSKETLALIATATLETGGFINPPADPVIGDRMPDGTIYAGVSPDTGNLMYSMPTDASLKLNFNEAANYAARLDALGHQDWRMPTKDELHVLFENRHAIGGFRGIGSKLGDWYASASKDGDWYSWNQRFSTGTR